MDIAYKMEKGNYSCTAVLPDAKYIDKAEITTGRFINENDVTNATRVAVIGRLVEEDLFITESAIGKYPSETVMIMNRIIEQSDPDHC